MLPHILRSILFVPSDRSDRFTKAMQSGADAVCIDLEDAVSTNKKDTARHTTIEFLNQTRTGPCALFVRPNPLETRAGLEDLLALLGPFKVLSGLLIPKVSSPDTLNAIALNLQSAGNDIELIALIEDAAGLRRALPIARHPRVSALALGSVDMASSTGIIPVTETLNPIRSALTMAAAEAGKMAIDGPFLRVSEATGLAADTHCAHRLGFVGKLAVHPQQIDTIHSVVTPSVDQIAHDRRIIGSAEQSDHGVILVDGLMVDRPVVIAAQRRLALAKQLHLC